MLEIGSVAVESVLKTILTPFLTFKWSGSRGAQRLRSIRHADCSLLHLHCCKSKSGLRSELKPGYSLESTETRIPFLLDRVYCTAPMRICVLFERRSVCPSRTLCQQLFFFPPSPCR